MYVQEHFFKTITVTISNIFTKPLNIKHLTKGMSINCIRIISY